MNVSEHDNFISSLCNGLFRIQLNLDQLEKEKGDLKEIRSIKRVISKITDELEDMETEIENPLGQAFDPGRTDFEAIGQPSENPEISRPTISKCERPIVRIKGKLLQKGKGIIEIPSAKKGKTEQRDSGSGIFCSAANSFSSDGLSKNGKLFSNEEKPPPDTTCPKPSASETINLKETGNSCQGKDQLSEFDQKVINFLKNLFNIGKGNRNE